MLPSNRLLNGSKDSIFNRPTTRPQPIHRAILSAWEVMAACAKIDPAEVAFLIRT
jgi:hypothetical protein